MRNLKHHVACGMERRKLNNGTSEQLKRIKREFLELLLHHQNINKDVAGMKKKT